jgi:hypothetical protein
LRTDQGLVIRKNVIEQNEVAGAKAFELYDTLVFKVADFLREKRSRIR